MNSILILTREKTIHVHFGELLDMGELTILNSHGNKVFHESFNSTFFEAITLDQPKGKYWLIIDSAQLKIKKSFHIN